MIRAEVVVSKRVGETTPLEKSIVPRVGRNLTDEIDAPFAVKFVGQFELVCAGGCPLPLTRLSI